jgi:hypothetical protein
MHDADWAGNQDRGPEMYIWLPIPDNQYHGRVESKKHIALSSAAQETVWIRRLITELGNELVPPWKTTEMPHAAKAKYPRFHGLAKHIDIWHHFIRE